MGVHADKSRIRWQARPARQGIPLEDRAGLSTAACMRAFELPGVAHARHVLSFAAAPEELDPATLTAALRQKGASVCLPRITGPGSLSLHACEIDDRLEEGPFGLRQPSAEMPEVFADSVDLVIVPVVAFDLHGMRLGFGGGYYDRLLASIPLAYRLALAYDGQLFEQVPAEDHDERVDAIVTPSRALVVQRHRGR